MKHLLPLLLFPAILLAQTPLNAPPATDSKPLIIDGIAAYVNNHTITITEVMKEIPGGLFKDLPAAEREPRLREIYSATLNAMIDSKLILDEAKASGAQLAAWAIDSRVQEIRDKNFKGDQALLAAELAKEGKTYGDWRTELEDDMTIQYMRYHNVDRTIVVPPKNIRAYYATNSVEYLSAEKIDVSMIILQSLEDTTLEDLGRTVTDLLDHNVEFARVAQTLSTKQAQEVGQISYKTMGFINPAEDLKPELADAVGQLKDGQHSPLLVVETVGYFLKRNATEAPRQMSLEDAWPFIESRLRDQLARERYRTWVDMLRRKSYVKILTLPR